MPKYLTIDQVSESLAVKRDTVYKWVAKRKIPFIKLPGGDLRFDEQKIENWVKNRTVNAKNIGVV